MLILRCWWYVEVRIDDETADDSSHGHVGVIYCEDKVRDFLYIYNRYFSSLTMNGVTNRISVGPVVVRRISVSASHLRFKEACRKLQGVFIKDPTKKWQGVSVTIQTLNVDVLHLKSTSESFYHEKKATKTVLVNPPPLDHSKLGEYREHRRRWLNIIIIIIIIRYW